MSHLRLSDYLGFLDPFDSLLILFPQLIETDAIFFPQLFRSTPAMRVGAGAFVGNVTNG